MDFGWEELERMAMAAYADDALAGDQYPSSDTIERWEKLFGYSYMEAVRLIGDQRNDVTRERMSEDHWALVKNEKEALGYDREAYEHSLQLPQWFKGQSATIPTTGPDDGTLLLFRLGGLLDSAEKVKEIAGMEELPVTKDGTNETGIVKFCLVDEGSKKKLEDWLVQRAVLQK